MINAYAILRDGKNDGFQTWTLIPEKQACWFQDKERPWQEVQTLWFPVAVLWNLPHWRISQAAFDLAGGWKKKPNLDPFRKQTSFFFPPSFVWCPLATYQSLNFRYLWKKIKLLSLCSSQREKNLIRSDISVTFNPGEIMHRYSNHIQRNPNTSATEINWLLFIKQAEILKSNTRNLLRSFRTSAESTKPKSGK